MIDSDRLAYSVDEAAAACDLSRAEGYRLVQRGEWPAFHVGRRTLIARSDLEAWIEAKRRETAPLRPIAHLMRRRA